MCLKIAFRAGTAAENLYLLCGLNDDEATKKYPSKAVLVVVVGWYSGFFSMVQFAENYCQMSDNYIQSRVSIEKFGSF